MCENMFLRSHLNSLPDSSEGLPGRAWNGDVCNILAD